MHAAQPRPHPTAISSAVVWWLLISLVIGAVFGFFASLLFISPYNGGTGVLSFGFWPLFLFLASSHPQQYLKHPNWWLALPLLAHILIIVGFVLYPPLALALLGPFLTLLTVAAITQRVKLASRVGWLVTLGCGLAAGVGAALVCWPMLGRGVDSLLITLVLVVSAGLAGPVGKALSIVSDAIRLRRNSSRGRAQDTPEQLSAPDSPSLSRRTALLGLGGLAGLTATGTGFTWLTRALLAHVVPLVTCKSFDQVQRLSWSPDGTCLISIAGYRFQGGWITVWEAASGQARFTLQNAVDQGLFSIEAAAWSPDGTRIALGSRWPLFEATDQNVVIVDAATLRPIITLSAGKPGAHQDVLAIAWSPDSTRLATATSQTQIWEAVTGKQLLQIDAGLFALAWSPDGRYLVADNEYAVQVWEAESGALLTTYRGHTHFAQMVAWSPDSTKVASGSLDGTVQVWDAHSGRHLLTYLGQPDGINAVAWSSDGSRIASAGIGDDVHVWDAETGTLLFLYKGHTDEVNALAWSPDGSRIASGSDDETIQIWQPM